MKRLYVVVRDDLAPGMQIAQACHAAREFTLEFPEVDVGENLVVLNATPFQLAQICLRAYQQKMCCTLFFEPDVDNELTAAALPGIAQKLVAQLPLALRSIV